MNLHRFRWLSCLACLLAGPLLTSAEEPLVLQFDFARTNGLIRALNGVNKGPLAPGGLLDLSTSQRELGIPLIRLHDCHWPNPDVVDIHVVFPDFNADPGRAESYDFRLTDEYLQAVRATGAQIVYRLGESIEHTTVKRFAHPPADADKWAAIALGVIRHYNEGWANGFYFDIRYWEIWNEPENRPAMWSGSDADYFRLYRAAAGAIKREFPHLQVGGPAVGASGNLTTSGFEPTDFVRHFLELCRTEHLPLDFFSWHCYTDDPLELVRRAQAIRRLLDENGFAHAESHLNEWNYLPDNSWAPLARDASADRRQACYAAMAGPPGAAFLTAALIELQSAPLDAANLFHGEAGSFGLFNEFGRPQKNYFALRAFDLLRDTPRAVTVVGGRPGELAAAAGLDQVAGRAGVLISNFSEARSKWRLEFQHLPWRGPTVVECRFVNAENDLELVRTEMLLPGDQALLLQLPRPSVALLQLRPGETPPENTGAK